jgi:mono/diheme cytochrome c family protein
MKTVLRIAALTIGATLFYAYVGHMVPQQITYPPEEVALKADMTTEEMVSAGEEIVGGKGTCLGCHTIGDDKPGRFPDLGGIGSRAGSRKQGLTDVEYLAESLYEPNVYIVEGFNPGMLAANKPPISLSDQEILAVIAYLQSLGATPNVTMATKLKYQGQAPAPGTAAARPSNATGEELMAMYACATCHSVDEPKALVGPTLYDVGSRLTPAELYESIMNPDAALAEGFPPGLMMATLGPTQFYDKVTATELKTLVDYLASRKGGK